MKPIKIELSTDIRQLELIPISDVHLGDPHCEIQRLMDTIDYIAEHENAYCILNGDLMDTAISTSVGDTYGAVLQPMEQLSQCVKIFGKIAPKILCVVGGNHEHRIYKSDGVDITELMCTQLGIHDRYSPTTALLFIRFGRIEKNCHNRRVCYTAYVSHGSGGGRREGGKINRLADMASIVDADIYVMGHTHLPVILKEAFYRVDTSNSKVALVNKLFVNTAAHLNYGGYGDAQGFKPASIDSPRIFLNGSEKHMKATL